MLKRISKWKRLLATALAMVMLFTNNCGVIEAFAENEGAVTNLELNAKIQVNNGGAVVKTGERFEYRLEYTVPQFGSEYTGAKLIFTLPAYVELVKNDQGNPVITGPDYKSVSYHEQTKTYTVSFKDKLPMHTTNTLVIDMITKNLVTPDDLTLDFDKGFTFQYQIEVDGEPAQESRKVEAGQVTTEASSNWQLTKENITSVDGKNYKRSDDGKTFEVTYRVTVEDKDTVQRLGRLGFASYKVIDKLPTGLPKDGAALEVKDVKMIRTSENVNLTAGTEYNVICDDAGAPVEIEFNTYNVIKEGESAQYLNVGDETNTTYEYTVVYPYDPYTTSGDALDIIEHELINTATLEYKLIEKDPATATDDALVNIGAYEDNVVNADVSVTKYVKFNGGELEVLDAAAAAKYNFTGDNAVKFTLYTDEACTNIAYNTNANRQLMQNIGLDKNGVAVFNEIRKGVYYIKEVSSHPGWENAGNIKVVIDDNGNVAYPENANTFAAVNVAKTINAVEFQKTGIDAYGTTSDKLTGATFTLTDKSDSSKTYTATSDANGKVRFNNIPNGNYTLKETAVSKALADKGYEVSNTTYEIAVSGGAVVNPVLGENNTYQNISTKGLLKIVKVDAQNKATKLSGAVFAVYGPYSSEAEADAAKAAPANDKLAATLTTGTNGEITSNPLKAGYYVLVETKAPVNYTSGSPTVVQVSAQSTVSKTIENNPQAQVRITKKGSETAGSLNVQELAGAKFEIYDAQGNQLYGVKSGDDYKNVSTDSTGREPVVLTTTLDATRVSVSNFVTLAPGSYQYKEIDVPAPFEPENKLVSFTVKQVAPAEGSNNWNISQTTQVDNYLKFGQIRIVKTTDNGNTDASAVNGAQFGVYASQADAQDNRNPVDTITTATYVENGQTVHGIGYTDVKLAVGQTYYIKETKAPAGYALNDEIKAVTITEADLQAEWTCQNKATVSIQITKEDSKTQAKLKGAKFGLYTAQNETSKVAEGTTDANGVVTFGNLNPTTTYYYKEISAPNGYVKINSGFTAITTGSTGATATATATVQNDCLATFKLHKTNDSGNAFKNVHFALIKVQDANKGILEDTSNLKDVNFTNTDSSGDASFNNLTPGRYWLVEKVPDGYETGKTNGETVSGDWKVVKVGTTEYFYKQVTVEAGQNMGDGYTAQTENITNTLTKGKIKITKVAADADGNPTTINLQNAKFGIYSDAACTKQVTTLTTGSDGTKTSGYLAPGTYYIKETTAPSGYIKSNDVYTVTVVAGKTTTKDQAGNNLTIANKKQGEFSIDKVAAYKVNGTNDVVREPLMGAVFTLYQYINGEKGDVVQTIDMTTVTNASSGSLNPGIYWLSETTVPAGYNAAADSLVWVYSDGTVKFASWVAGKSLNELTWETKNSNKITVDNESQQPRIRLIKKEYGTNNLLDGAKFEVYVKNGDEWLPVYDDGSFVQVGSNGQLVLVSGTARNPSNDSQYLQGEALTPKLEADHTYGFKEIEAPDNYYFDPDNAWKEVVIPAGATGEYRVVFENYPNIQVPGIKLAEDGKTKLSGAVLAIFETESDANAMLNILKTQYNEYKNPLTAAVVNTNKATWNIVDTATSNGNGQFTFDNLIPAKTYYIVEVVAPNGYQMAKDNSGNYFYYKVVVSNPYNANAPFSEVYVGSAKQENVHSLVITNYAKHKIWLDKKVVLSGEEYWVDGAVFTIYPSKTEDGQLRPDTANAIGTMGLSGDNLPGRFLSELLPEGTYWLRETTVPDGFTEATVRTGTDYLDIGGIRYYKVELGRDVDNDWFKNNPVYNEAQNGRFVLKKIDSENSKNVQATFKVEKVGDENFKSFTFTTPASGYYESGYLAPGVYKLTETKVTGDYTISDQPIYISIAAGKITDGSAGTALKEGVTAYQPTDEVVLDQNGNFTNQIQVKNVPKGKFFIQKTGEWMNESENLQGVKFDIYKKISDSFDADKTAGKIKNITTGANGIADSGMLDAGEYWYIETGVSDGKQAEYGQSSYTAKAVTVLAGQQSRTQINTEKVVNTSKFGKFQVTKVDSVDQTTISGVTFDIYSNQECTNKVGTMIGSNGVYTSPRLPAGSYWLKETNVPDAYTINKGKVFGPYTVTANGLNVVNEKIENEHDKSLTVYKYEKLGDQATQNKIAGVKFGLYASLADAQSKTNIIGGEKTTDQADKVAWADLTDGTYYLRELSAPAQYLLQDPDNFTATDENPAANIYKITISGKNGDNSFDYTYNVYNLRLGGFKLDKVISWTSGQTGGVIPGSEIAFKLYKNAVAQENLIATLTTDANGSISHTDQLPAGDYILVEDAATVDGIYNAYDKPAQVPDTDQDGNYIDETGNIHIRVLASQTNEVFTGNNAVRNTANFGRFELFKKTYTTNDHQNMIGLSGAKYKLEKKVDGTWTEIGTIEVNDTADVTGKYVSGAMAPGEYRVTEIQAPTSIQNSAQVNVSFTVDPEPIEFTVTEATTVKIEQYDGIYRNLKVTKTSDQKNDNAPLAGVTFELYHAKATAAAGEYAYTEDLSAYVDPNAQERIGEAKQTGADGVVVFTSLAPGKYLLVETNAPEGYAKKIAVVEINESRSYLDVEQTYTLANTSTMGRIVIRKEDANGNLITKDSAQNAEFKIYAASDTAFATPLDTVSVDSTGYAKTCLLPTGSYWVVETKAPSGYTLDERLLPLEKMVSVSGDQDPQIDFAQVSKDAEYGYVDGVIFRNDVKSNTCELNASIQKLVRMPGENTFEDVSVAANDSLMFKDVTAEFKITNLTPTNDNELPFSEFVVTDETMKFMDQSGNVIAALNNPTSENFVMNSIVILPAYNMLEQLSESEDAVCANVYAKVGNKAAEWQLVAENVDVSEGTDLIQLPDNAVAFKVAYLNTGVNFWAEGIELEVTFKQRPSDPEIPQVRKIENTAVLSWEDTSLNESGLPAHQTGSVSDVAAVTFPVYDAKLPKLALKNNVVNRPSGNKYFSGGTIDFETEGYVPETSDADLEHPVMSINLPPYTSLDTTKYSELEGGINGIRATLKDGRVCTFTITKVNETNENGQPYEKYVLDFGEDFVLPVGESIKLEYTANISLDVPDAVLSIESRGFIGSAKQLPLTAENPTGKSYLRADESEEGADSGFDTGLKDLGNEIKGDDESLIYLNRPVSVELTRTDSRLIRKYVSVDGENWLTTEVPVVKPGDNYYYKLTLVNGGDPVRRLRMIDIMPFNGDTQEFRAMDGGTTMSRATDLPYGEGYEQVELVSVMPQTDDNMSVTVYYYVESDEVTANVANRDWTAANRGANDLPMLTSNAADAWGAGWTTSAPADMRAVTAIGVEVAYLNDTSLAGGDDYSVVLKMRAPGYTAEHMNEYADAIIGNTTAGTVTAVGAKDTDPVTAIDRVSSNEVHTKLYITTGALGDYAFYDNNDNGIQDEGDIPARNIPVTLYRRKATTSMTDEPQWEVYKTTYTDQTTGKYWFDELPCNYMIPGLDQTAENFDPTNPANYIGNTYFEYRVEFGIPDGYAATIREVGEDRAVDSNINEFGVTDPITLALTVGADGKLVGEVNPTIDAGYVKLVNLGDYVWIDYNKNGIQDEGEIGLNGVTVNLYKLDSAEDTIEGKVPYKTTVTDTKDGNDGYYLFEQLPKGYYVVEFDLTTVDKHTGYTTQYAFTVNDAGSNGADSDAAFVKNENDQIMYTENIHLTEDDMTWDAGVTVYSALGGFVFDDQDYNDTQSIPTEVGQETANGIPLPGTVVTLYKVNEDGTLDPVPVGKQTVGEDGRYFFDKLEEGRYKVHFDYPDKYIGVKEGVGDYLHDSETKFFDDSTLNSGFTDIIELPADTADLTHDAGAYLVSSIGDYVWEDINRDGIQDKNEEPVKGITVTLQQKLGDGDWTTIETTETDENGLYLFEGLKSSDHYDVQYRVAFAIPLTVELTTDNAGDDRAKDSNALPELDVDYGYFTNEVKPPYGKSDMTIDAGLYYKDGLCEVGDYVWYDDDKDGIQDKDEKGVEGILVKLERCESDNVWDESAWKFVADTKTNANGKYIFKGLEPGRYRVAFGLGEPWIVTVSRVGDIALDSDAIRHRGDYYYTSAFFLEEGDSDMTWDAGIYKPTVVIVPPTTEPTEAPTTEPTEAPTIAPNPNTPSTGDNHNMVIWVAIMLSSMAILVILLKTKKKVTK